LLLWWPVTDQRFKLGNEAWSYYRFAGDSQGWIAIVKLGVIELLVFGTAFAISVRCSRRRYRVAVAAVEPTTGAITCRVPKR